MANGLPTSRSDAPGQGFGQWMHHTPPRLHGPLANTRPKQRTLHRHLAADGARHRRACASRPHRSADNGFRATAIHATCFEMNSACTFASSDPALPRESGPVRRDCSRGAQSRLRVRHPPRSCRGLRRLTLFRSLIAWLAFASTRSINAARGWHRHPKRTAPRDLMACLHAQSADPIRSRAL